jgi:hypothetical protein
MRISALWPGRVRQCREAEEEEEEEEGEGEGEDPKTTNLGFIGLSSE